MRSSRILTQFDFPLFGAVVLLSTIGLVGVYSATAEYAGSSLFLRQLLWLGLGVAVCLLALSLDYHFLIDRAFVLYGLCLVVLVAVLLFGSEINGSRSWIRFGSVGFQPSEFAKIGVVLALARYLSELGTNYLQRRHLVALAGITLGPMVLVIMQGDLGTALTYLPIMLGSMLVAGLKPRFLVGVLILTLLVAPFAWFTLEDYQKQRILVTFDPELDPQGVGYQTNQSLIAIGSGGITGKGVGEGLQGQLGFVPQIHSDFIFSLLAEEWGLLGGTLLLTLYLFAMMRLISVGENARDRAGILIITGIASLFCFHVAVNVGMTLGVMPAIGIPLPLVSYGGSSILTFYLAMGLVLNVHSRRFVYSDTLVDLGSRARPSSRP